MIRHLKLARWVALCGLAVWLLHGAAAVAIDHSMRPYTNYDRGGTCVPNVSGFGYYRTSWRQWPGEQRLEQAFPQSIGVEALPAPEPEGPVEAPVDAPQPLPEPLPRSGDILPDGMLPEPPQGGGILPPDEPIPAEPAIEEPAPAPLIPQTPLPEEPSPAEGVFPEIEEPAEPPASSFESGIPMFEPTPLSPDGSQTPLPEPLESITPPASGGILDPEPGFPGEPEPVAPAPLDPAAEDPLPGLRSIVPDTLDDSSDAAPMPGKMLSAPQLVAADSSTPDMQEPTRAKRPEMSSTEDLSHGQLEARPTGFREIDPVEQPSDVPSSRADWVSARNPGFRGGPTQPTVGGWEAPTAPLPGEDVGGTVSTDEPMALESSDEVPRAMPVESPVDEAPAADSPGLQVEGPAPTEQPVDGVQSATADASTEQNAVEPSAFEVPDSARPNDTKAVALDGFCLYELSQNERWIDGDPQWSVAHHGRTYLFSSSQYRQRFLADPDRYAPAYAGYDPVLVVEGNRFIAGKTDFCVHYDGRLYMFSSAVTVARFQRDPQRYATAP